MSHGLNQGGHGGHGQGRVGRDELNGLLHVLRERRTTLVDHLARHPLPLLTFRPSPGAWTLRDVAEHLVLSEHWTLVSIERHETRAPLRRHWYHGPLRWLIGRGLESRIRIPVTGKIITPAGSALDDTARRWASVHEAWQAWLDRTTIGRLNESVFRHPLGVPMTAAETLVFLRRHHDHHRHQVRRIEQAFARVNTTAGDHVAL